VYVCVCACVCVHVCVSVCGVGGTNGDPETPEDAKQNTFKFEMGM
jgi:hypothetical protein